VEALALDLAKQAKVLDSLLLLLFFFRMSRMQMQQKAYYRGT
jgi:hypothetical protein